MSEVNYGRLAQARMQMGGDHHHEESKPNAGGHADDHSASPTPATPAADNQAAHQQRDAMDNS
jgi:hypothetical protein